MASSLTLYPVGGLPFPSSQAERWQLEGAKRTPTRGVCLSVPEHDARMGSVPWCCCCSRILYEGSKGTAMLPASLPSSRP